MKLIYNINMVFNHIISLWNKLNDKMRENKENSLYLYILFTERRIAINIESISLCQWLYIMSPEIFIDVIFVYCNDVRMKFDMYRCYFIYDVWREENCQWYVMSNNVKGELLCYCQNEPIPDDRRYIPY